MSAPYVVEVKVLDFLDNHSTQKPLSGEPDTVKIFNLLHYIDEHVGGALCFTHFCLPELGSRFVDGIWTIEIDCCCREQSAVVEKRVEKIFMRGR
jgi:hypothetical protein